MSGRHVYAHAAFDQGASARRGRRRMTTLAEGIDRSLRALQDAARPLTPVYPSGPARSFNDLGKIGPSGNFLYAPPPRRWRG